MVIVSGNVGGFVYYFYYVYCIIDVGKSWEFLYVFDFFNLDVWIVLVFFEVDILLVFINE